jgi:hypothetical protein
VPLRGPDLMAPDKAACVGTCQCLLEVSFFAFMMVVSVPQPGSSLVWLILIVFVVAICSFPLVSL